MYFKEHCFGLTAETLIDRVVELKYIGGCYGGAARPSEFLCLLLKMLIIAPEKDIVTAFIEQDDYKYLRVLGLLYVRLTEGAKECYELIEPFYQDYRRIAFRETSGKYKIIHIDEFCDSILREEIFCDVNLPRIPKRMELEVEEILEPRISSLQVEDKEERPRSRSRSRERESAKPPKLAGEKHRESASDSD